MITYISLDQYLHPNYTLYQICKICVSFAVQYSLDPDHFVRPDLSVSKLFAKVISKQQKLEITWKGLKHNIKKQIEPEYILNDVMAQSLTDQEQSGLGLCSVHS